MTTTAVEWAATREAVALGHPWVGEEHLLLAVDRRGSYIAAAIGDDPNAAGVPSGRITG